MQLANGQIRVSLFCGGRGSATIVRELLRWPNVQLNLLVNAYDDGLSTGELRDFIPGMLGPSDFRKNLSYLLDLYSNQQYTLQQVLEYRLPMDFSEHDLLSLEKYVGTLETPVSTLPLPMRALFAQLDRDLKDKLCRYLVRFFRYYRENNKPFKFADCSLGNLLFAGAYLDHHSNFNSATKDLAELFCSQARLINVSNGENRSLAALKGNGEILYREADIVGPQTENRIETIFFLSKPVTDEERAVL